MNPARELFVALIIIGGLTTIFEPTALAEYWVHRTTLVLDPIPHNIYQGTHLTFSGRLLTSDDKTPLPNRLIFIQYDSPYDWTRTLATTTTDSSGYFTISWTAQPKGYSGGTYNIFAKFNGDDGSFWSISKQYQLIVTPR